MKTSKLLHGRNPLRHHGPLRRRGAMLVLMLLMLIVVLVMTVFAVDVAYMQLVRTELRTSTDAAARAASEALARTQSVADARQAARDVAAANRVAGDPLQLDDADIVFGSASASNQGVFTFSPRRGTCELRARAGTPDREFSFRQRAVVSGRPAGNRHV